MADKFSKYERTDKFSRYEQSQPVDQPQEQGFWEKMNPFNPEGYLAGTAGTPGTKTDAFIRGASNAATLGFGDEAQAFLRSLVPGNPSYQELRDQERAAAARAYEENPGSYIAGSITGALPQAFTVGRAASLGKTAASRIARAGGTSAALGAVEGAGNAQTMGDIPAEAAKQAALSGVVGGVAPQAAFEGVRALLPKAAPKVWQKASEVLPRSAAALPTAAGPLIGGLGNIGINQFRSDRPDYSTDPYSAAIEDAKAGAIGAGIGFAAQHGPSMLYKGAKAVGGIEMPNPEIGVNKVPFTGGKTYNEQFRPLLEKLFPKYSQDAAETELMRKLQPGYEPGPVPTPGKYEQPSKPMLDKLNQPAVEKGQELRRTEMLKESTPEGRAQTNTTSPLHEGKASTPYPVAEESFGPSAHTAQFAPPESMLRDYLKAGDKSTEWYETYLKSRAPDVEKLRKGLQPMVDRGMSPEYADIVASGRNPTPEDITAELLRGDVNKNWFKLPGFKDPRYERIVQDRPNIPNEEYLQRLEELERIRMKETMDSMRVGNTPQKKINP